jgi:hypothetical protein
VNKTYTVLLSIIFVMTFFVINGANANSAGMENQEVLPVSRKPRNWRMSSAKAVTELVAVTVKL